MFAFRPRPACRTTCVLARPVERERAHVSPVQSTVIKLPETLRTHFWHALPQYDGCAHPEQRSVASRTQTTQTRSEVKSAMSEAERGRHTNHWMQCLLQREAAGAVAIQGGGVATRVLYLFLRAVSR